MNRLFVSALLGVVLIAPALPAVAADTATSKPNYNLSALGNATVAAEWAMNANQKVTVNSGLRFGAGQPEVCIANPHFNPDNDENGPRASEPYTDSTPYAGTSTAALSAACR